MYHSLTIVLEELSPNKAISEILQGNGSSLGPAYAITGKNGKIAFILTIAGHDEEVLQLLAAIKEAEATMTHRPDNE